MLSLSSSNAFGAKGGWLKGGFFLALTGCAALPSSAAGPSSAALPAGSPSRTPSLEASANAKADAEDKASPKAAGPQVLAGACTPAPELASWLGVQNVSFLVDFLDGEDLLLQGDGVYITHLHERPASAGRYELCGRQLRLSGYMGSETLILEDLEYREPLLQARWGEKKVLLHRSLASSPSSPAQTASLAPPSSPALSPVSSPVAPQAQPACLVLSVGADKGLAHIGVLHALHEQGIFVDCVVGTSMGSLVGGFFAAHPEQDVASAYRRLVGDYARRAKAEGFSYGGLGFLLGFEARDWDRLRASLHDEFGSRRLESLPLRYRTEYQELSPSGARRVVVTGGILADEISRSVANPLLFPKLGLSPGGALDPGLDRAAAIPMELACEQFPEHQLIVSIVGGDEPLFSPKMSCPYQLVRIPNLNLDAARAISAQSPEYDRLIASGYRAARQQLDLSKLPSHPAGKPSQPLLQLSLELEAQVAKRKPDGTSWDLAGDAPEPKLELRIEAAPGSDPYGQTLGSLLEQTGESGYELKLRVPAVRVRPGSLVKLRLEDVDLRENDRIGDFEFRLGPEEEREYQLTRHGTTLKLRVHPAVN